MTSKDKIPDDLGVKIGSKLERFWTEVLTTAKTQLEQAKLDVLLQEEVVNIASKKVEIEHKRFLKT